MTKSQHDSETPARWQQVITACAFIYHDFEGFIKVFLPRRAYSKKFLPGLYELPGGHIEFGEELIPGLKREIAEELHREIDVGDPFAAFTYINEVKGSHSVEIVYFAQFIGPIDDIKLNTEDHVDYKWLTREDVIKHRREFIPEGQVNHKYADDPEYLNILKGFDVLEDKA